MEIIKQGAEAILYLDELEGQRVLVKERIKKKYRIKEIDEKLRKERTAKETKLIREARMVGVSTPQILHVDDKNQKIFMEFIKGPQVKEYLLGASDADAVEICEQIGTSIGRLHKSGIVHGDLTTSNMIIRDREVFFIDFGLGQETTRIEDMGVDMKLLYGAFNAVHFEKLDIFWNAVIRGYKKEYKNAETVIKKIDEISERGRYAKREPREK